MNKRLALIRIFAAQAAAELQRQRAECKMREREEKLNLLLDSAMDAVVEVNENLEVTQVNLAAEKSFWCPPGKLVGRDFKILLTLKRSNS